MAGRSDPKAWALAAVLLGSGLGALLGTPEAASTDHRTRLAPTDFQLPEGWIATGTLGYTPWSGRTFASDLEDPVVFTIDLGHLGNAEQFRQGPRTHFLLLRANVYSYAYEDGDRRLDPIDGPHDGPGDEPCRDEPTPVFTVAVNGVEVGTVHAILDPNNFEIDCRGEHVYLYGVPTSAGVLRRHILVEAVYRHFRNFQQNVLFHVPAAAVRDGPNEITVRVHDANHSHPRTHRDVDGWYVDIGRAQMQLVAPPLVIAHGWMHEWGKEAHEVHLAGWQPELALAIKERVREEYGQDPWAWAPSVAPITVTSLGCAHRAPPGPDARLVQAGQGIFLFAFDPKQDVRTSGCQLAKAIRALGKEVGYAYRQGDHPEGVWFLGFSMGGLVGRWAFQREADMLDVLGRYTSVGTPHLGSKWGDKYTWLVDKAFGPYRDVGGDRIREWFGWEDWWKSTVQARKYEKNARDWWAVPPGKWTGSGELLDFRADFELMENGNRVLKALNGDIADLHGKAYAIVGTGADLGPFDPLVDDGLLGGPLAPLIAYVADGDLIVSKDSARAGGALESATCRALHVDELPVRHYFDEPACRNLIHEWLFAERGPGLRAGAAGAAAAGAAGDASLRQAAEAAFDLEPDPDTGEASAVLAWPVDAAASAWVFVHWAGAAEDLAMSLESPSGEVLTQANAGDRNATWDVRQVLGLQRALVAVPDPEPGTWRLRVNLSEDAPLEGVAGLVSLGLRTPLALEAETPDRADPGEAVLVTARLTAPVDEATVEVLMLPANLSAALRDDGAAPDEAAGDSSYAGWLTAPPEDGEQVLRIAANGTRDGHAFHRLAEIPLTVHGAYDLHADALALDPPDPWWGEPVTATLRATNTGPSAAPGILAGWAADAADAHGAPAGGSLHLGTLAPGASLDATFTWTAGPDPGPVDALLHGEGLEPTANNRASAWLAAVPTPATAATFDGPRGLDGWHVGPVTTTLGPSHGGPAPYASTAYHLDPGPWTTYRGPFQVVEDGTPLLAFRSIDADGRIERVRTAALRIDATPPDARIASPSAAALHVAGLVAPGPFTMPVVAGPVDVDLRIHDTTSGAARAELRIDGWLLATFEAPGNATTWPWDSTQASLGRHTLQLTAWDRAGNRATTTQDVWVAATRTLEVHHDPHANLDRLALPLALPEA